ncbi:MAG: phosphoglucosamine mutase [Actinomycetota bacterium]|nr:phosphoglucosamine mutase [Actinomycetota bacterium]
MNGRESHDFSRGRDVNLRFGTDGVRGVAGSELTPELVLALGRAAGRVVVGDSQVWYLGRDTRRSGPMVSAALAAGLAAEGADVVDLGVVPTPAVAAIAASRRAPAAMVSASHNPFADNGIKLFGPGGRKLDDGTEARVEAELARLVGAQGSSGEQPRREGTGVGALSTDPQIRSWYRDRVLDVGLGGRSLEGIRVAVDCANGAASGLAPAVLTGAGADVVAVLGDEPDGRNINAACGSTDPSKLSAAVVAHGADVGLAFDGDADRLIAVDSTGRVVDGDRLLAIFAADLRHRGRLRGDTVVVTVMSNLGFHRAMAAEGIAVHQTGVGDRLVLAALEDGNWSLGGEQSGHIIFADLATTGDGILAGVALLDALCRERRTLEDWAGGIMDRVPQVLRNVTVTDRAGLDDATAVWDAVAAVERDLGSDGRVLLRPSGTEPLVRVMVEAPSEAVAAAAADRLERALRAALS